ncbi:MAG: hypothetical protein K0S53_2559 [Bacteroidetes bacterium]|jgi:capsule polysaccharide export protein KpsC/LpsZ|nr:hypothetical protein [Bacteroidota bacterium]MDF2453756.1 hypothetical protein [Bacteroidota bacterium]
MNIFVYATQETCTPHTETELELIQQHLDKNDTVFRVICKGDMPACDINPTHEYLKCLKCDNNRKCGEKLLNGSPHHLPIISNSYVPDFTDLNNCKNIAELKKIKFRNFDVGMAIASSLISEFREPDLDVIKHKELIRKFFIGTIRTYLTALDHIKKHKPSIVYIFNGRLAYEKAALRAAQESNTTYIVHERGCDKYHYDLFVNNSPHDFDYHLNQLDTYWEKGLHSDEERNKIANEFFTSRRKGTQKEWVSFTEKQRHDLMPENFDPTKINIGIFNSSVDEYAATDKVKEYPFYQNQEDFIDTIVKKFNDKPDYHFYLRVHPNLSPVKNLQTERISQLSNKNLTIIPGTSEVSSYKLLDHCEKVITFGSTMGIEAVYWEKPSILVSRSSYDTDDSVYKAKSYEETVELIETDIKPRGKTTALKVGYYNMVKGIKFKIFKPIDLFKGTYEGVNVMEKENLFTFLVFKFSRFKFTKPFIDFYGWLYKKYKLKLWF